IVRIFPFVDGDDPDAVRVGRAYDALAARWELGRDAGLRPGAVAEAAWFARRAGAPMAVPLLHALDDGLEVQVTANERSFTDTSRFFVPNPALDDWSAGMAEAQEGLAALDQKIRDAYGIAPPDPHWQTWYNQRVIPREL